MPTAIRCGLRRQLMAATALATLTGMLAPGAMAQGTGWPQQPIRMIVPFPAGGPTDFAARLVADKLTRSLGQTVVVENRGGAAGMLGTTAVAQAKGDGYTIGLIGNGLVTLTPFVRKDVPFDPLKDLVPLTKAVDIPLLVVANPSVPAPDMSAFIRYARANPGKLSYGSDGQASLTHLSFEMFKEAQGLRIVHIPYRGTAQLTTDLLSNVIQVSMSGIAGPLPYVKSGKLRALAVTSRERAAALPDVPTMIELGMKDFEVTTWFGFFAPAGIPAAVASKLNEHLGLALRDPEVAAKLRTAGMEAAPTSQQEMDRIVRHYIRQWQGVIQRADIKLEE
ncbi:tripartite tricarboxylate transporter substrate binding protein [uncultured Pseudacidovorax sp.]|uniref:Bug family tripartite tricarboxylate transporter substrate binding protein n=1 Tax=uncultured Pseudacidovorax sp. TaxID=679313 RepID=UPI0025DF3198|nr:tripartite tricarboxylate transporter substrate binding protein [uncultured Pseudacidovorax sp.]